MTKLNVNDLPPKLRAQVLEQHGTGSRAEPSGPRTSATATADGWCWQCGEKITTWPMWDRHAAETGHSRLEMIEPYAG